MASGEAFADDLRGAAQVDEAFGAAEGALVAGEEAGGGVLGCGGCSG